MAESSEGQKIADKPRAAAYPRAFGNYLLLSRLARGGMGEVFLAKSGGIAGIEKHCVVKTLRAHFTADREYVTRFIDEARVVVQLAHRNIGQIFDVGRVNKQFYLAMEYIAGRDLRSMAERLQHVGMPLPENVALFILGEIVEALDYAHRHVDPGTGRPLNVVHRDISPQNVMVSFEGEVKLIDFGLAHSTMKVEKTQPNIVMGKMAYMAPEQARGDDVDGRADLFSAAVLGYELFTGERYYEGLGFDQIWSIAGTGGYRPRLWDQLHPDLAKALGKGLEAEVSDRFRTGADFKDALLEYQMNRRLKPVGREMRQVMAELFGDESLSHRELIARFQNVSAIRSAPDPAPEDESQSFAVANVESFLDGAVVPDRHSEVIPLHTPDKTATEVAPAALTSDTTADPAVDRTDERSVIPEMPTLIQPLSDSGELVDRVKPGLDQDATYVVRNTRDLAMASDDVEAPGRRAGGPSTRLLAALAGVVVSLAGVTLLLWVAVSPSSKAADAQALDAPPTGVQATRPDRAPDGEGDDATLREEPPSSADGDPAAPTDSAPTDSAPTDSAPTDSAPTDSAPTDSAPTDSAPTDSAPTNSAPTNSARVAGSAAGDEPAPSDPAATSTRSEGDSALAASSGSGADGTEGKDDVDKAPAGASSRDGRGEDLGAAQARQGDERADADRQKKRRRSRRAAKTSRPSKKPPVKAAAAPKPEAEKPKLSAAGRAAYASTGTSRSKVWDFLQTHCRPLVSCAKRMKKPNLRKVPLSEVGPLTEKALACAKKCNAQGR